MSEREFAPRGPAEVAYYLDQKALELDQLMNQQQEAHEVLEDAELVWTQHYDEIVEQLEEELAGKRFPGENQRLSIARRRGGWEKWTTYRRATKAAERFDRKAQQARAIISACQSEAKLLGPPP